MEISIANKPCYPTYRIMTNSLGMPMIESVKDGLTFRERLIISAMEGMLANPALLDQHTESTAGWIAEHSILQADTIIKQLEAEK